MYCPKCGKNVDQLAHYCPECGANLAGSGKRSGGWQKGKLTGGYAVQKRQNSARVSKWFYMGSIAIGGLLSWFFLEIAFGFSFALLLYILIVSMVLIYKMWDSIQDGYARTTPGKAVGFLFIPVFQIYWMFQVYWGFSKDYNKYIKRHNINANPLPEGVFLGYICFSFLVSILGFTELVGIYIVLFIIQFGLNLFMVSKICDGINALH